MAKLKDSGSYGGSDPFADMTVGETRTHCCSGGSQITITRTSRPFICDWVDSSNIRLAQTGSGFRWVVTEGLQTQLVSLKSARQIGGDA